MKFEHDKSIEFRHVSFRLPNGKTLLADLNLCVREKRWCYSEEAAPGRRRR
jgi:hypothetical protein